jgi:hypothetical protein
MYKIKCFNQASTLTPTPGVRVHNPYLRFLSRLCNGYLAPFLCAGLAEQCGLSY